MDIKESLWHKALSPYVKKGEDDGIVLSYHSGEINPTKPGENRKVVHTMEEFDPDGRVKKFHEGLEWTDEETEEESWKAIIRYVEKAGVEQFVKRRGRPYTRNADFNLSQKRRRFSKLSREEVEEKFGNVEAKFANDI